MNDYKIKVENYFDAVDELDKKFNEATTDEERWGFLNYNRALLYGFPIKKLDQIYTIEMLEDDGVSNFKLLKSKDTITFESNGVKYVYKKQYYSEKGVRGYKVYYCLFAYYKNREYWVSVDTSNKAGFSGAANFLYMTIFRIEAASILCQNDKNVYDSQSQKYIDSANVVKEEIKRQLKLYNMYGELISKNK